MIDDIEVPEVEATSEIVEQSATIEEAESKPEQTTKPKLKDNEYKNFAALRQKNDQLAKERDDALKRLQEIESTNDDINLGPDDIAEGKHLTKIHKNLNKEIKNLKDELQSYRKQSSEASTEARIKSTYNDFDSVVTVDNLSALRDSHPELAATIQSAPDLYAQAVTAYTMIKKLGISADKQNEGDREKVRANTNKPRPAASISPQQGDNPLTRANAFADGLTDELKEQLRKEMYSAMKNN